MVKIKNLFRLNLVYGLFCTIRYYKNWFSILFGYLLHISPRHYIIRFGKVEIPPIGHFYGAFEHLALLLNNDWEVKLNSDGILLSNKDHRFICRNDIGSDITELKEIFIDKIYENKALSGIVIDIGMSSSNSSIFFAKNGANFVIGVEPSNSSYELAKKNIKLNGLTNIKTYNAFLCSEDSKRKTFINSKSGYITNSIETKNEIIVEGITLERIVEENNIDTINTLKMDCEGCEYEFFESVSSSLLEKINFIYLEYHSGYSRILINKIMNIFDIIVHKKIDKENGFIVFRKR